MGQDRRREKVGWYACRQVQRVNRKKCRKGTRKRLGEME